MLFSLLGSKINKYTFKHAAPSQSGSNLPSLYVIYVFAHKHFYFKDWLLLWQQIKYRWTDLSLHTQSAEKQNKMCHETKEVSWEHTSVFGKPPADFFHQTYNHQGNVCISHNMEKKNKNT